MTIRSIFSEVANGLNLRFDLSTFVFPRTGIHREIALAKARPKKSKTIAFINREWSLKTDTKCACNRAVPDLDRHEGCHKNLQERMNNQWIIGELLARASL